MRTLRIFILSCLAGCGTQYRDTGSAITSQADFNVEKYLGTWYEIARYPVTFQRGCTATVATYGAIDADTISVHNSCRQNAPDGPLREVKGTADLVGPGQLLVQFDSVPILRAPYWVLWVDDAYTIAVVGVPNGRAGWILARAPIISSAQRAVAHAVLVDNGYDTRALFDVPHAKTVP